MATTPRAEPETEIQFVGRTAITVPKGATLAASESHPVLGCTWARFHVHNASGDGAIAGDEPETFTWRREE